MTKRREHEVLLERLNAIDRKVDRIEVATLVRDPGNAISADAYNGLRKQLVAAVTARTTHLAQLSQLDLAVRDGASSAELGRLVDEWLRQADLERSVDTHHAEFFSVVAGEGPDLVVITPAYVDRTTGRIVRQGTARRTDDDQLANQETNP